MSIFAPLFLVALLMFLQGPLLQASCAVSGARPPSYGRALVTAILAVVLSTIAGTAWSWTFGVLVGLFSAWLAWGLSIGVTGLVSASILRTRLRIPFRQAVLVAIVHHVLSTGLAAAAWFLYGLF